MGYRVNSITIKMDLYVEFEGSHMVEFSYAPGPDDPLVIAALNKNDELLKAHLVQDAPPQLLG